MLQEVAIVAAALHRRAKKLDALADNPFTPHMINERGVALEPESLRWLAQEFRELADELEKI